MVPVSPGYPSHGMTSLIHSTNTQQPFAQPAQVTIHSQIRKLLHETIRKLIYIQYKTYTKHVHPTGSHARPLDIYRSPFSPSSGIFIHGQPVIQALLLSYGDGGANHQQHIITILRVTAHVDCIYYIQ